MAVTTVLASLKHQTGIGQARIAVELELKFEWLLRGPIAVAVLHKRNLLYDAVCTRGCGVGAPVDQDRELMRYGQRWGTGGSCVRGCKGHAHRIQRRNHGRRRISASIWEH